MVSSAEIIRNGLYNAGIIILNIINFKVQRKFTILS